MSAGQQRRVMIGRALAGASVDGEVQMLLLDEPSNALDLAAQHDLREMLRGLAQRGVAIRDDHASHCRHPAGDQSCCHDARRRNVADGEKSEQLTECRLSDLFGRKITLTERDGFWNAW